MARGRSLGLAIALAAALAPPVGAEAGPQQAPPGGALFDVGNLGHSKEPITVASDTLEYDYKADVVVYRGAVQAAQGNTTLRSDTLTVTFEKRNGQAGDSEKAHAAADPPASDSPRVREIVAVGHVRIDQGTRWATGGRATFDQTARTLVLTETPVMHDGPNEVAGDRVIVYLDENRSVVEGGRKRVKAVLYPNKDQELAPKTERRTGEAATDAPAAPPAPAASASPPGEVARP